MPRLIDDLRAAERVQAPFSLDHSKGPGWEKHARRILGLIREDLDIPVLLLDNVAEYYMAGTDQEFWDLTRDFPNLAPPYAMYWTEYRVPRMIHSREHGDTPLAGSGCGLKARTGMLWVASTEFDGENIPPNCKWMVMAEIFTDYDVRGHNIEGPLGTWIFMIDAEGVLVGNPQMQGYCDPQWSEAMAGFVSWMHPSLLAVSFLHCRNVKLVDVVPDKPLAKKYHARTGIWPTAYHTLEIEPLKAILRHEGKSDTVGVAKAMHICRGHFRDYRQGAGLFGKYKQLVWTPQTIRGTKGDKAPPREIRIKI